jgi:hypothetical protein
MVIPGQVPKRPRPLWLMEDGEAMVGSLVNEKQGVLGTFYARQEHRSPILPTICWVLTRDGL